MDRRQFLLATGSVLASASWANTAYAATLAPAARRLTLSVAGLDQASWIMVQANLLARQIEQVSQHALLVQVVDEAVVPFADISLLAASALVDKDAGFAFATGLPGNEALTPEALDAWLTGGGGQPLLDDLSATHGLKVMAAAHSGRSFLWSKTPFSKAEDFAGLAVQADGLARNVAAGLGAEPWRILEGPPAEAFARGSLAAVEASITSLVSSQMLAHAKFAASSALAPHGTTAALTIRLDAWHAMTTLQQAAITAAARANYLESVYLNRRFDVLNRTSLAQSYAIDVTPVPDALAASIQTVSRAMVAQAAASSGSARNLNLSYMSFLLNPLNS